MPTQEEIRAVERMTAIATSQGWTVMQVDYNGDQPRLTMQLRAPVGAPQPPK